MIQGTTGFDISKNISNTNLLINGSFQVWQRGTTFTNVSNAQTFTADRWYLRGSGNSSISKTSNGILVKAGTVIPQMAQSVEWNQEEDYYTFSMYAKFSGITSFRIAITTSSTNQLVTEPIVPTNNWKLYTWTVKIPSVSQLDIFPVSNVNGTTSGSYEIEYVKLERGKMATLNIVKKYSEELLNCQRYFVRYGRITDSTMGAVKWAPFALTQCNTTMVAGILELPTEMYKIPTLSGFGALQVRLVTAGSGVSGVTFSDGVSDSKSSISVVASGTFSSSVTNYRIDTLNLNIPFDVNAEMTVWM